MTKIFYKWPQAQVELISAWWCPLGSPLATTDLVHNSKDKNTFQTTIKGKLHKKISMENGKYGKITPTLMLGRPPSKNQFFGEIFFDQNGLKTTPPTRLSKFRKIPQY